MKNSSVELSPMGEELQRIYLIGIAEGAYQYDASVFGRDYNSQAYRDIVNGCTAEKYPVGMAINRLPHIADSEILQIEDEDLEKQGG